MTVKAFAGIGSRTTPPDALSLLRRASQWLVEHGWTCRSGGAEGADTACETGALEALADLANASADPPWGALEVFLPWPTFGRGRDWYDRQQRHPDAVLPVTALSRPTPEAVALAAAVHPAWRLCSDAARLLHGRNSHQVLGHDLARPVSFVLCWTKDGALGTPEAPVTGQTGGTGQAIRIAASRGIEVLNLQRPEHRARVEAKIRRASGIDTPDTYHELTGDLFALDPPPDALVNSVNCKGAMGRGVALAFKQRHPDLYRDYRRACANAEVTPGAVWVWRPGARSKHPVVLNLAVKDDWRYPARMEWIEAGLLQLRDARARWGITSLALPRIGAQNGWLAWAPIHALIKRHLGDAPGLDVTLVTHRPTAP